MNVFRCCQLRRFAVMPLETSYKRDTMALDRVPRAVEIFRWLAGFKAKALIQVKVRASQMGKP